MKKTLGAVALLTAFLVHPAVAADLPPIKIGFINAYTGGNYFVHPASQGIKLAIDEINAKGGVLGRPLEVISRDSKMDPGEAVRLAEELRTRDKVDALINCDASNTSIAVGGWAKQNHVPFVVGCSEADSVIWQQGNEYMARVNPGGYAWVSGSIQKAMEIFGDKLKNKRWVSVAPSFEFGRSLVQTAKDIAAAKGLNANWVEEQWPVYDKLSAGPTIATLERANPDVVFSVLFGTDVVKFIREAKKRDFIKDRIFIFPTLAVPEHLDMLGAELPQGWVSAGFPYDEIRQKNPFLDDFIKRYEVAFHERAKSSYAVTGYDSIVALAAAIEKAGSIDSEKIHLAFDNLRFVTPYGEETLRKVDHQATVSYWVGLTDIVGDTPKISHWTEFNLGDTSPADEAILKMRSAGSGEKK